MKRFVPFFMLLLLLSLPFGVQADTVRTAWPQIWSSRNAFLACLEFGRQWTSVGHCGIKRNFSYIQLLYIHDMAWDGIRSELGMGMGMALAMQWLRANKIREPEGRWRNYTATRISSAFCWKYQFNWHVPQRKNMFISNDFHIIEYIYGSCYVIKYKTSFL